MSQSKQPALTADKVTGKLPEANMEYRPQSSQSGYEAVYGQQRSQSRSSSRQRRRLGWCEDLRRNSPQSFSLAAATLIFASGGMNLVSCIGFAPENLYYTHMQVSWFVAVIIGACMSTIFVHKISKRIFNLIASVFVGIGGVFYITATQSNSTVISARYCDGFAFGLTIIPAIMAGSEQSVKRFRGFILSSEQVGLVSGAIIKMIYTENWGVHKPNAVHGTLALIFGVLALICTFTLTIESPVFLLRKDFEEEAVVVLRKLQKTKVVTHETYALLNESKELLEDDMARGSSKNISSGWIPMIKTTFLRCIVSMSISFPLTLTFLLATSMTSRSGSLGSYAYILMRLIGTVFSTLFLDTVGRKIPSALALLFGGGILFSVGFLSMNFWNTPIRYIQPIVFLMLFYQLMSGIMSPTSTCYLSEAFSVSVKPLFILATVIAENVLQILVCCLISKHSIPNFALALGGLQMIYSALYFLTMPETMQTTLREALKMFQRIFVVGLSSDDEEEEYEEGETDV